MLLEQMHLVGDRRRCACSSMRKACLTYLTSTSRFELDSSERGCQIDAECCAGYIPQFAVSEHSDKSVCSRGQRPAKQGVGTINSLCNIFWFLLSALLLPFTSVLHCTALWLGFRSLSGRRARIYRRRRFKPKKNVFSGTWSALYLIMGFASWLVWRQGGLRIQAVPLCLYLLQLAVNLWAWPPIFVGGQRRRYAFVDSAGILHCSPHCKLMEYHL